MPSSLGARAKKVSRYGSRTCFLVREKEKEGGGFLIRMAKRSKTHNKWAMKERKKAPSIWCKETGYFKAMKDEDFEFNKSGIKERERRYLSR